MAQFRTRHPWNHGYALPDHVLAEPPGRGTLTTVQAPRKTIPKIPSGWTGGYAIPGYIMSEPHGRGAVHRHWAPRKTFQQSIPEPLAGVWDTVKSVTKKVLPYTNPLSAQVALAKTDTGKKLICKVATQEEAAIAAQIYGTAQGGPQAGTAAGTGVKLVGSLCRTPSGEPGYVLPTKPATPPWVPIAVAGGIIGLALLLR